MKILAVRHAGFAEKLAGVVLLLAASAVVSVAARADFGTPFPTLPSNFFDTAQATSLANFDACLMGKGAALLKSFGETAGQCGGMGESFQNLSAFDADTKCPSVGGMKPEYSCGDVSQGGRFSEARFKALLAGTQSSCVALACEKTKMSLIQEDLACFQREANALSAQIQQLQSQYVANVAAMQEYMTQMQALEEHRVKQQEFAQELLHGGKSTGRRGLLNIQATATNMMNQIEGEAAEVETVYRDLDTAEKNLVEFTEIYKTSRARQCFAEEKVYRCSNRSDAPMVSSVDYLACVYADAFRVSKGGKTYTTNAAAKDDALREEAEIRTAIARVMAEMPSDADLPDVGAESGAFAAQKSKIAAHTGKRSFEGVLKKLEAEMKRFDQRQVQAQTGRRVAVANWAKARMSQCYKNASSEVDRMKKSSAGPFAEWKEALKTKKTAADGRFNQTVNQYKSLFREMTNELFGASYTLDVRCTGNDPAKRKSCVTEIKDQLSNFVNGSITQEGGALMQIRGTMDQTHPVVFSCPNLNQCISAVQNASQRLGEEATKIRTTADANRKRFNTSVESFTKATAQLMSQQNSILQGRLAKLNQQLAGLGVGRGVEFPPLEGKPLAFDDGTGLVKLEGNVLETVSAYMNPPMLDVSGNTFGMALEGMSQKSAEIGERMGEYASARASVEQLAEECTQEEMADLSGGVGEMLSEWQSLNCMYAASVCGKGDASLRDLSATLQSLSQENIIIDTDRLGTGVAGMCGTPGSTNRAHGQARTRESLQGKLEKLEELIQSCSAGIAKKGCGQRNVDGTYQGLEQQRTNLEKQIARLDKDLSGYDKAVPAKCDQIYADLEHRSNRLEDLQRRRMGAGRALGQTK